MRQSALIVFASATMVLSPAVVCAQFVQQGPKLVVSDATVDSMGWSAAISADGNTAIVGDPEDNHEIGAVFIFTRSGSTWTQQGPKLVASDATGIAGLGYSVAISADGNTAIAAGVFDNNYAGSTWIFVRSGSTWTQQGPKLADIGADAVALSADGNTAIVGNWEDNGGVGALRVFTRSGTTWTQQGEKLVAAFGNRAPGLGLSVAVSADGNTVIAGGLFDQAAWIFTRSGTTWTQQGGKLTPSDASGSSTQFGQAVALSADGNTAAVGADHDDNLRGAVWIFTRSGSTWTQQGPKLVGTGAAGDGRATQGVSVSLSSDGNVLLVGGPRDGFVPDLTDPYDSSGCVTPLPIGATWVFKRAGHVWSQSGSKLVGTGGVPYGCAGVYQGRATSISADGLTAIVTGPFDTRSLRPSGAVWIFSAVANDLRRAGDRDGDGRTDLTVYHSDSGMWSSITSASGFTNTMNRSWGGPAYVAAPGDYDGDGKTDLGLYDGNTGYWYVLLSSTNFTSVLSKGAGGPGWQAVPRDYDGDGKTDFAVYNMTTGQWYGLKSSTNYTTAFAVNWGGDDYLPVPADYDGDGKADIGVYNMSTGLWSILLSTTNNTTSLGRYAGGGGWTPVPADYDGDGKADMVVYNYNPGQWYGLKSSANFTPGINVMWGGSNYQPVKGDYDGDGKADFATYVSSTGMWYILLSGASYTTSMVRAWGGVGYAAIPQFP
jgi:hypothetical protein